MRYDPCLGTDSKKSVTKIKPFADVHDSTAPTDFANHLANRGLGALSLSKKIFILWAASW